MIGWLCGTLRAKQPPFLLVDVGGVGYEVEAPMTTIYDLPAVGETVSLHIHHAVREDAQQLFGFLREGDRALFRQLVRVSGVGPKLALAILSGMTSRDFELCVQAGDAAALTRLPGVGKRTAERLVVEMRDRLGGSGTGAFPGGIPVPAAAGAPADPVADAVNALVALGYKPAEASRRVRDAAGDGMACEEIIREALRGAGKGG
jgi:Holliday junction DNA helicase RuvA